MEVFNLLENLEFSSDEEVEEIIYEDEKMRVLRTMSLDQETDYMTQDEDELVILMAGEGSIQTDDEIIKMKASDFLYIPHGQSHKVINQYRAVWFCVFIKNK
ncbi:cupin domain-containing protein [Anaerococcus prevotii]|uniref:Cupin domain protein n=1 Tax=Anaerococcus prevotii ACS-065-V-Col13 TaxID=879305 RepID=F0GW25_9FIRM|nr:cupin domain-containing protein [Anaerococcus prevotii]EGC81957.1 cupin domain protein [Anaerococcus prevotii ACS-065-V-Col13]